MWQRSGSVFLTHVSPKAETQTEAAETGSRQLPGASCTWAEPLFFIKTSQVDPRAWVEGGRKAQREGERG